MGPAQLLMLLCTLDNLLFAIPVLCAGVEDLRLI
jgi:hypothetical protein